MLTIVLRILSVLGILLLALCALAVTILLLPSTRSIRECVHIQKESLLFSLDQEFSQVSDRA